jgi:hypothetical protein
MSNEEFRVTRFEEPEIQFSEGSSSSPKRGLFRYGPRLKNAGHHTINVGIIGDRDSIRLLNDLFTRMEGIIHPDLEEDSGAEEDDEDGISISPWKIPYPGANPDSPLNVSIRLHDRWKAPLGEDVFMSLDAKNTVRGKMEQFLEDLEEDISFLSDDDPEPDVLVICIPSKVMDECTPDDQDHANVSADGSDLRNRIKLIGMENDIPTQLIKPSTLEITSEQQRASRAWNLTVGMLYKSQRGHPWKTKHLEEGACYAGISFYKARGDDEENEVRAALAHVFARKDYNIIQSEPMEDLKEDRNGQPHLSEEGAKQVVERIVEYYKKRNRGRKPERIVLHKTSPYWEDERDGFIEGAGDVGLKDFIHIKTRNTGIRLFPDGKFPPLRGTLFSIPAEDRHFLYTTGYTPEMATYEGSNIPEPIEIRPDKQCQSNSEKICKEILFLTKLDWNTSDFAVKEPVTLKVSRKVSDVLSEEYADPKEASTQYFYYM